jgi:hypothetical protein
LGKLERDTESFVTLYEELSEKRDKGRDIGGYGFVTLGTAMLTGF